MQQNEISQTTEKIKELVKEIEVNYRYKKQVEQRVSEIDEEYQRKRFGFAKYQELLKKALGERTKEETLQYYDSYIFLLLNQIDQLNSFLFDYYYGQNVEKIQLKVAEKIEKPEGLKKPFVKLEEQKRKEEKWEKPRKITFREIRETRIPEIPEKAEIPLPEAPRPIPIARPIPKPTPKPITALKAEVIKPEAGKIGKKLSFLEAFADKIKSFFVPKPKFKEVLEVGKKKKEKKPFLRFEEAAEEIAEEKGGKKEEKKKVQPMLIKKMPEFEEFKPGEGVSKISPYYLAQEAKKIKEILKKQKEVKAYEPSTLGSFANVTVRRISIFLLEKFPDAFKEFYYSLRRANIKLLSNTYLNIMIFFTMLTFAATFPVFLVWYYATGQPLIVFFFRSLIFSIILSAIVYTAFYYYPLQIIRKRRRSINANLPFAINHMSAMIGAGVPPAAMLKLTSESEEYEEISVELKKIVELVDYFGYDLVTAIKTTATSSPSPTLKEFFDGFVSTVETGGDLKLYLRQKSDESMLSYRLEREKYVETISTYSDIYTGVLIAAPLFFVVALSLVSILGGTVGGVSVNVLMALGTYLFVPMLNIGFLVFLELTQPEV